MEHERRIVGSVREIRSEYPRIGGYKLWLMLICLFGRENMPGRDSFFAILRRRGLMLPHPKARHTTNSNHRFHKWKNLTKGLVPTAANQLWVADITYIPLAGGDVAYLHLITDAYSHMIVGWTLSGSLKAAVSIQTLQMALEQAIRQSGMECLTRLVHHSDRGIQYCCDAYVSILKEYGIRISMTEDYKPTDNAIAERANGIIKSEGLYPRKQLPTFAQAQEFISRFIRFYNCRRPHMSIGYKTPAEVHGQQGEQKRMWKSKFYDKNKVENQKECVSWQRQTEDGHLTRRQADSLDLNRIRAFFASPLYERIRQAEHVWRERKFLVRISDLQLPDQPQYNDTNAMLSGIMDLVFEEPDGLVLVDYKTDYVQGGEMLTERYQRQLLLYRRTLALLHQKPVKETVLYSFHLNRAIPLPEEAT